MDDEFVREPDKIVNERLLDDGLLPNEIFYDRFLHIDNGYEMNNDIEKAIQLSLQDNRLQEKNKQLDEDMIEKYYQEFHEETKRRTEIFEKFEKQLKRIMSLDNENYVNAKHLLDIIQLYCSCKIDVYKIDEKLFHHLNSFISNIRMEKKVFDVLSNIIEIEYL
jgi:hypothetical protein